LKRLKMNVPIDEDFILNTPNYRNASPEDQTKLAAAIREIQARERLFALPHHRNWHVHTLRCVECGRIEENRGRLAVRCPDCQRVYSRRLATKAQRKRRHLANGLLRVVDFVEFSMVLPGKVKCRECGAEFGARRSTARFCSAKCRVYWHRSRKR